MAEYQEYQEYDAYYDEPSSGNRTWLIVAVVVVVLLLCCCCLMVVAGVALLSGDIVDELAGLVSVLPTFVSMTAPA
jgi:hypothetical protein